MTAPLRASVFVGTSLDGFLARPNGDFHLETRTYASGLVTSQYEVAATAADAR